MRARSALALSLSLGAVLAAGCSVVPSPNRPSWRIFVLEPVAPPTAAGLLPRVDAPVVVVATPESGAGYSTREMAYSRGGGELEYFASHRWADTPARMLIPLLQGALMRTGAFRAVAASPTRALGDLIVESEILVFRQELGEGSPRFRVALRVTLVRPAESGNMDSRRFEIEEPMDTAGPTVGVEAANRAVGRILADVAAFCAGTDSSSHLRIP